MVPPLADPQDALAPGKKITVLAKLNTIQARTVITDDQLESVVGKCELDLDNGCERPRQGIGDTRKTLLNAQTAPARLGFRLRGRIAP